jgi:hypothetical protein
VSVTRRALHAKGEACREIEKLAPFAMLAQAAARFSARRIAVRFARAVPSIHPLLRRDRALRARGIGPGRPA